MELFDFKTADILPSYLIFDPKTGKIERLTGQKQNENCLEITNDKYKEISNSSLFRYRVEFNPATTIYEVVRFPRCAITSHHCLAAGHD